MNYKDYVYLKIPKETFEKIIEEKKEVPWYELEFWKREYERNVFKKKLGANIANSVKRKKTLKKIYEALDNYYRGLFKEKEDLTSYKLAKLAGVNYLTAKKYWEKEGWKYKFLQDPRGSLIEFKATYLI